MILYVFFGQLTVRNLRKKEALKNDMGVEFVSGWDIINAAQALLLLKRLSDRLEAGPLSLMYANTILLREHTTSIDRLVGACFYWALTLSELVLIGVVVLDWVGF